MSLNSKETTQLVLDYQAGKVSFDELFHQLELLIHDCYWKMTSREKVTQMRIMEEEDLKSLCWVVFYQCARDFKVEKGCTFSTYFYQNVQFEIKHEYRKYYRKKRRHQGLVSLDDSVGEGFKLSEKIGYNPFQKVEEQEFFEFVEDEMNELNFEPEVKTSILIHLTTGEPLMRVGARYNISQSIASRRLRTLKKSLKEKNECEMVCIEKEHKPREQFMLKEY